MIPLATLEKDGFISESGALTVNCYFKPTGFETAQKECEGYGDQEEKEKTDDKKDGKEPEKNNQGNQDNQGTDDNQDNQGDDYGENDGQAQ